MYLKKLRINLIHLIISGFFLINNIWAGEISLGAGIMPGDANPPNSSIVGEDTNAFPKQAGAYLYTGSGSWLKVCFGSTSYSSLNSLPSGGKTYITVGANQYKVIEECGSAPPIVTPPILALRPPTCGNGFKEAGEGCDSPTFATGKLQCSVTGAPPGSYCQINCKCSGGFTGLAAQHPPGPGGNPGGPPGPFGPPGTPVPAVGGTVYAIDDKPTKPKTVTDSTGGLIVPGLRGQTENNDPRGQTASQAGNPQGQGSSVTAPPTSDSRAATAPLNPGGTQAGNQATPSGDNTNTLNAGNTQAGNAGNATTPSPSGDGTAFQSGNTSAAGAATNPPSNNGSTVTPPPTSGDNTTGFNSTGSSAGSAIPESTNNGGGSVTPPPANSGDNTTGLNPGGTSAGSSLPESGQSGSVSPPPSSGQPNQDPAKPNSGNGQTGHNQSSDGSIGGAAPGTDCDPGIQSNCQNR
jgi:hypothetical protein